MSTPRSRRSYLGLLAILIAFAEYSQAGVLQLNWNICLVSLGMLSAVYWLRVPDAELAPPLDPWLGWTALLLPLYVAIQLVPLPVPVLGVLSPARAELLDKLAHVASPASFAPLSIAPATTSVYLLRIAAYTLVFLLVRELAWHARKRNSMAAVIPLIGIAAIEAALGLAQSVNGEESAHGTYGNKNHFAGLLEMVLPLAVVFGLALVIGRRSRSSPSTSRALSGGAVLALAAIIVGGLVASISKMGYVAGISGLAVMGALALWTSLQGWRRWLAAAALVVLFVFGLVFLPSDELMRAFSALASDEWATGEGRFPIFLNALGLIRSYWLVGCGLGNFQTGFLKFQTAIIDRDFTFAHNDYLQLASEIGLVGFVIVMTLMLGVFWKAFAAATRDQDRLARLLGLGCAGALAAIAVHSLVDFNTYIPANAMVLAWISGIAASLPSRNKSTAHRAVLFRRFALVLSVALVIYGAAWIVFGTSYRSDPTAERLFCRLGICDTDAVLDKQVASHNGNVAALPAGDLVAALRRDPASPARWCDLAESFAQQGQTERSRYCFANALELGPYVPMVLMRASHFFFDQREQQRALEENARVLAKTPTYDALIFDWYREKNIPLAEVLSHGLAGDRRASQAYLRYWISLQNMDNASAVWDWMLSRSYADDQVARSYVNFVFNARKYEAAALAWAHYLGEHRNGYLESDFLYNGDFESEPEGMPFDWRVEGLGDKVEAARDSKIAHTGTHSVRIHFTGNDNVNYGHTSETTFVTPGAYRFEAFVRTEGITTDEGIGFEISSDVPRLDLKTAKLLGTNDWTKIELPVTVPPGARLLVVRVIRQPSLKFDSLIAGTAWIDSVRLVRMDERPQRQQEKEKR
ncbi:MAG: O-antigen ligase family protein [Acidobacteriia bacterium]|nr:O-antigen ligase family protein [Terriglobia bacterium]